MDELLAVRKRVDEELRETRIVSLLLDGTDPETFLELYTTYLVNAGWYARFSPELMAAGGGRLINVNRPLGNYLLHHAEEEAGHDQWARDDLDDLGAGGSAIDDRTQVPACQALVGYVHYLAHHANPVGLFGWMYVLEAVGDDLGRAATEGLGDSMGEGTPTRFVGGHAVADVGHTAEIAEQIETHVTADEDYGAVVDAATVVADLYLRMFRQIGAEAV